MFSNPLCANEGVSVLGNDSNILEPLNFLGTVVIDTGAHDEILLIGLDDQVPEIFLICCQISCTWSSSKVSDRQRSIPRLNPPIASVNLCPSLFEHENPGLLAISLGKAGLSIFARNMVVHDAQLLLSILTVDYPAAACAVSFFAGKEAPDSIRVLGKCSQTAEKITVTETSLFDVRWLNFVLEELKILSSQ